MHACLPTLWEASDSVVSRDDDWTGWMLSHVTKTCYPERVRSVHGSSHSNPLQFRCKKTKSAGDLLFELLVKLGVRCVENECDSTNVAPLSANASTQHLNEDNGNNDEIDDESDDDSLGELERCFEIVDDNNENDDADGEEIENDVEAVVNYEGLHTDGNYHCKDIATLFSKHKSVKTIHHSDFPAALSDMNCGVDCLIVYRDNNCDGSLRDGMPQTSGSEREREWELRFVACTNAGRGNSNRSIFCRHGSQSFPQWWKQEQKHKDIRQMKLSDGLPTEATCNFDVAVYVRKKKMPLDECRDLFLETMGNQTSARCKEHDFPLVVSPHKSSKFCSFLREDGSECAKEKVAFQCPVQGCSSALCTEHHNSLSVMPGEQLQVPPANTGDTNVTAGATQCHDSPGDEENDLMLGEETSSMENEDVVPTDESPLVQDLVLDSDSVHSDTTENRNNFAVVANPIDCGNANDAMDGDDVGFSEQEFPVTTNHQEPIKIQGDPKTISGCTILNDMGSLLVRRNDKLKGTKNQQFFLNRIVSTTPGRTIPLLHPEGMLFPSISGRAKTAMDRSLGQFLQVFWLTTVPSGSTESPACSHILHPG